MKDRIREIRKENNLTQTEFGKKIGVAGNTVTGYEAGVRNPSDAIVLAICRVFLINEDWLRTGDGEKYTQRDNTDFLYGMAMMRNNEFQMRLVNLILQLDDKELDFLEGIIDKLQKK